MWKICHRRAKGRCCECVCVGGCLSIGTQLTLTPLASNSPPLFHLFLCFCSFYFWLCFSFTFLIESLWKNSTLVSVGPSKKGIVHSSARIAKGYWPPTEARWTSRTGRAWQERGQGRPSAETEGGKSAGGFELG